MTTRYGEANNPYMGDEYDDRKPTKYITYLDANNLYGWAMSNPIANWWIQVDGRGRYKKL